MASVDISKILVCLKLNVCRLLTMMGKSSNVKTMKIWGHTPKRILSRDELHFCGSNSISVEKSEPLWLP